MATLLPLLILKDHRKSQLLGEAPAELANRLTRPIRDNGDMGFCAPPIMRGTGDVEAKEEDRIIQSETNHLSQFTQSLMLFVSAGCLSLKMF